MDLMQLEMFVAMVEERSFHKAAERVLRTQPAVSIALRKLEQELGAPLFDRSNRSSYNLTDTGEILYGYAKRMLNLRDDAKLALEELHSVRSGRVRIGANESTTLYVLPKLIVAFRERYPKVKIEVYRHVSARLPAELHERNLDFAILSFPPEDRELEAFAIMSDELVLISSPDHRLAGRDRVSIRELGGESFVAHNVRSPSREKVIEAFRRFQTPLNIGIEIATIETIKRFVAMKLGLAFVPLMCVQEETARGELAVIPVEGFRHERQLWVVRRRTDAHSHAAEAFMTVISALSTEFGKSGSNQTARGPKDAERNSKAPDSTGLLN
ncbi:MAG TPA: LysR family transcriptional regulator [Blastocatellia bacterium]|nr:LysR family transcriptional regulator [Blastocatellia bacterium]